MLAALGMTADVRQGNAAADPAAVDTVYVVNPTGNNVKVGTTITVTVWADVVNPSAPSSAPTLTGGSEPFAPGADVTVTWPAQSCPSGQTLSGYNVEVSGNGAVVKVQDQSAGGSRTAVITAGTGPFTVSFLYFCGQLSSPSSPTLSVDVQAPSTAPSVPPVAGTDG